MYDEANAESESLWQQERDHCAHEGEIPETRFRVWDVGLGLWFWVCGSGFWVRGSEFRDDDHIARTRGTANMMG